MLGHRCGSVFLALLVVAPLCFSFPVVNKVGDDVVIETTYGPIKGYLDADKGVTVFKGVPFAAPPTGNNRFRPPQPLVPWKDTLDCTRARSVCPQLDIMGPVKLGNEDCLFLEVYVPHPLPAEPLPVMFWIYGGGYVLGDGDEFTLYDGRHLAKQRNVIVVTPNYRVDIFGFMALDALIEEDPGRTTGNYALLDQRAAMKWTQDNIVNFGGDAKRVTIFGESAGGFSVCWHVSNPGSRGLFTAAIMESGSCDSKQFFRPMEKAQNFSLLMSEVVGCNITKDPHLDVVACMRAQSTSDIMEKVVSWLDPDWPYHKGYHPDRPLLPVLAPAMPWGPAIDKSPEGLPDLPLNLIKAGKFNKVPFLSGTTKDEGTIFVPMVVLCARGKFPLDDAGFRTVMLHFFSEAEVDKIEAAYPPSSFPNTDARAAAALRDYFFLCGTRRTLRTIASFGVPTWKYEFTYPFDGPFRFLGDHHGSELRMVFDNDFPPIIGKLSPDEQRMADVFGQYWGNMAYNHTPGSLRGEYGLAWPQYNETAGETMLLSLPPTTTVNVSSTICDFWDSLEH